MDESTQQTLHALEESLWRSETRFDDALMETTFAADFIEFGRSGRRYIRAEILPGHMAGSRLDAEAAAARVSGALADECAGTGELHQRGGL